MYHVITMSVEKSTPQEPNDNHTEGKPDESFDKLKLAMIINFRDALITRYLADPVARKIIVEGIAEARSDVEIAQLLAAEDVRGTASALRTARWLGTTEPAGRTEEQNRNNLVKAGQLWRQENEQAAAQHQKAASLAAIETTRGVPVKYTPELQEIIQIVLENGGTYRQVAQVLTELGFETTAAAAKHAARLWGIENRVSEERAAETRRRESAVRALAEQGLSLAEIRQELVDSHTSGQIARAPHSAGLRLERLDWQRSTVNGIPLREYAVQYRNSTKSFSEAWERFNTFLEENNLQPVSYAAYKSAIKRYN